MEFQPNESYSSKNGRKICEDYVEIEKRIHEIMAGEIKEQRFHVSYKFKHIKCFHINKD